MSNSPNSWTTLLARKARSPSRWSIRTRLLTRDAQQRQASELGLRFGEYVHWMAFTAANPAMTDAALLSEYVEQFARLATNLGRADDATGDVLQALDAAIDLQLSSGASVAALYRAKASYLRSEYTESDLRRGAIQAAIDSAEHGSEDWAIATVDLCGYQTDISQYGQALQTVRNLRRDIPSNLHDGKYECAALAYEGFVLFTSFRDLSLAEERLRAACAFEQRAIADRSIGLWVAMAYHYLGRLAEVRGQYRTSVDLYLKSQDLAERSREDLMSDAFQQLRIAEPLTAAGLFAEAQDHLDTAYSLVMACSNRSSARLQVELGAATLAAAKGDTEGAMRTVEDARRRSRELGFWRGELLCQGYLLALAIRRRQLLRLPSLALGILKGALFGELRRNGLLRLLIRIPVVLPVAIRRMSGPRRRGAVEPMEFCPCRRHSHGESAADQAAAA